MGVLGDRDVEVITNLEGRGRFEGFLSSFDFTRLAGFGGKGTRFIEAHCPEPFVEATVFGHLSSLSNMAGKVKSGCVC